MKFLLLNILICQFIVHSISSQTLGLIQHNSVTIAQIFSQHTARWIEAGLPFENQIMNFNDGNERTSGNFQQLK